MQNSPDSSLPPEMSGNGQGGTAGGAPGRSIDLEAESTETETDALREVSRLIERAPPPRRAKAGATEPPPPPKLPTDCIGIGCLIRTRLQQLAEECGENRDCWRAKLSGGDESAQVAQ